MGRRGFVLIVLLSAGLILSACGGGNDDEGSSGSGDSEGNGSIDATVQEWAVIPSVASTSSGEVTINISNKGTETHEFVVLKTDLDLLDLPTAKDGSLDEEGEGVEGVDEVEDIPAGETAELTVDLEPGNYVFACNIVEKEDGETVSHFANGMKTSFTVK
ncbi:MAG TPA: cupredoxin domain-containing protein [Actinomycetota bacterium]|nr:cupredoxin domain-containing protein [Actinomycetota bacterium]